MKWSQRVVSDIWQRSALTKSRLCAEAGLSRTSLDAYLKGTAQPSLEQIERLARAAGLTPKLSLAPAPEPISPQFVAVLEFGDLFPRKPKDPPVNLGPVWRAARARVNSSA